MSDRPDWLPASKSDAVAAIRELDKLLATRGLAMTKEGRLYKLVNTVNNSGMTPKLVLAMLVRSRK